MSIFIIHKNSTIKVSVVVGIEEGAVGTVTTVCNLVSIPVSLCVSIYVGIMLVIVATLGKSSPTISGIPEDAGLWLSKLIVCNASGSHLPV